MLAISLFPSFFEEQDIKSHIDSLPFGESEKVRLLSMKNQDARRLSLSALIALQELLHRFDISGEPVICRTANRKPYFTSLPYFFSLSHACSLSVAALSDKCIGVDVEFIDKQRDIFNLSKKFFSPNEQEHILNSTDPFFEFYSLWTKKEAYAKLTGEGIISICRKDIQYSLENYKQYIIEANDKKAILSLCYQAEDENITILDNSKEISVYEL